MRDESPRVGRPRKGTQRKPKDRSERYRAHTSQNSYTFDNEDDFHMPSDSRESKQDVSHINMLTSPTSLPSLALSMDSASSEINQFEENDNGIGSHEAFCAFCNCGSEMAQILGQINRYYPSPDFDPFQYEEQIQGGISRDSSADNFNDRSRDSFESGRPGDIPLRPEKRSVGRPPGKRKKRGRHLTPRQHSLSIDMCTFGTPYRPEISDVFDADGCIWAHHCCAAWSAGVCQTDSYDLENVDKAAYKAIGEQCSHCNRHGASTECQVQKCTKLYHYPCCASAGAFQDIKSMILLCPDHLDHAARLAGSEAYCVLCNKAGDISKQLFCTSCGRHYHGQCLDPPVSVSAIVRMGWQCPECKVCQGCRQPGDDEKMLFCDECDKGFHTYCLSPPMSSVPKTAWKCYSCRKCEDCGSNVPGNGPSCRWHFNYTVCDKCYQQRKKGTMPCCPMCGKAVRSSSGEFSRQCVKCCKFVHCRCDKILTSDDSDYSCPHCRQDDMDEDSEVSSIMDPKEESNDSLMLSPVHSSTTDLDAEFLGQRTVTIAEAEAISRTATGFLQREPSPLLKQNEIEDLDLKGMDINFDEVMMETGLHGPLMHDLDDLKPDNGDSLSSPPHISPASPYLNQLPSREEKQLTRISAAPGKTGRGKKKMPPMRCRGRPPGTAGRGKKNKGPRGGRPRSKTASTSGSNKENIQAGVVNAIDTSRKDDSDDPEGLHSTVVMISTKDRFTLEQDICMCCGSFGKGSEGHLIACAQCGQCFHPYCVNIKINKVVMTKGWRCLDCTVCEGCGKNEDEGKLLLCDGCDISYHIYCLDPPLDEVPSDGWKCQWCVECVNCGAKNPGVGCKWMSGYTQCGPCASDVSCPVCNKTYLDDELVVKCMHCSRWLHGDCDGLTSEDDIELAATYTYHCYLCREKTGHFGIFSTSLTNIVQRGVYTTNDGKVTGLQSVIVTQTTTTVMASGVANRRSKSINNSKSNRNPLTTSGWNQRQPAGPIKASAEGTFEVQLPGLKVRGKREDNADNDNISLTDDGLRQIKSLVVKASSRSNRNKEKQAKLASIDDRATERETKTAGQLTETSACSEDIGENRQPICPPIDPTDLSNNDSSFDAGSLPRGEKERRGPGRPSVDRRGDNIRNKKPTDKRDNAMDFFGPSLLKVSKKQRTKDSATDTQSSEDEPSKAERYPGSKQVIKGPSYAELEMNKSPHVSKMVSAGVSHTGSWQSGVKVDHITEELQHPDSLYKTLNMLVTGNEDIDSRNIQRERELTQRKAQQNFPSSNIVPSIRHPSKSNEPDQNNSMGQGNDIAQTGDLDLMGLADLPHVDGHEVEEIFAGLEREMSVEGTPQSHGQSPMETNVTEFPKTGAGDFVKEQARQVDSPGAFQAQNRLNVGPSQRPETVLPAGFPDHQQQQRMDIPRQEFPPYDVYTSRQPYSLDQNVNYKPGQRLIQAQSAETDAFKAVFGEEPEVKSKGREGATSPKIDGQKQLKKWEQDEKLDNLATISPVLYANIMHPELKIEYPEWPNRARAIARLWRKLPQGQREPFRLRARDNRVKQKDQGRKLGPFQKTATPTSIEESTHFYDTSSNLSSEMPGNMHSETSTNNTLSSQMTISGAQIPQGSTQSFHDAMQSRLSVEEELFPRSASRNTERTELIHSSQSAVQGSESIIQTSSATMSLPNVSSPSSQFSYPQQSAGSYGRAPSRGSNKSQSFSDLASHDADFSTPTTPVFASSPFSNSPGVISPSLPVETSVSEKRKLKRGNKASKEQTEMEKEEKKRRLALEQEKERQWKLLQQQRLREQQSHQQTSTIQQVMMMKEQMRKDSGKPGRKSQPVFTSEKDHGVNEIRSNVLPHVEPLALTQSAASKDTRNVNQILESLTDSSKQRVIGPSNTITTPSNHASQADFLKMSMQQSSHQSISQIGFQGSNITAGDPVSTQFSFDSNRSQQGMELDSLLQINDSDLLKVAGPTSLHNDVSNVSSSANSMPNVYVSNALTSLQMSTEGKNETITAKETLNFANEPNTAGALMQQQGITVALTVPTPGVEQSGILGGEGSISDSKPAGNNSNQVPKAMPGFFLDSQPGVQIGANETMDKQQSAGLGQQQQQQQVHLYQQQQFMAAQQQYIQWQLQQRNPELFQSMTTPIQFSSYTDKDLPEVDSEEQHQERIRFLYRQRQMQKQQVVQIQQQLHQQQVYTPQQVVPGTTTRPQMDQTQHYFVQQLMQYQQQIPEALQQQFLIEYSRQMQQRSDVSQNALQYDKFLAELAQRYGYPIQQSNAQTVSVMQHGVTWPNVSTGTFHPSLQQVLAYSGIDEEKAKELTPQQLYQLQVQHSLMMQMAASGLYPTQTTNMKTQPPATAAASRKGSTSAGQVKKPREVKKAVAHDKTLKTETSVKGPSVEEKVTDSNEDSSKPVAKGLENVKPTSDSQVTSDLPTKVDNEAPSNVQSSSQSLVSSSISDKVDIKPVLTKTSPTANAPEAAKGVNKGISLPVIEIKEEKHIVESGNQPKEVDHAAKEISKTSTIPMSKDIPVSSAVSSSEVTKPTTNVSPPVCVDGIHCGTDSESEDATDVPEPKRSIPEPVPTPTKLGGIGKSNADDIKKINESSNICADGIHCGTDSEDDSSASKVKDTKAPCTDGIHCGTDTEDEEGPPKVFKKVPCTDGIHCGTDSEEETEKTERKQPCTDGIHCGTDSEDEGNVTASKRPAANEKGSSRNVCADGIHCGTDSEGEGEGDSLNKPNEKNGGGSVPAEQHSTPSRPLVVVCRESTTVSTPQAHATSAAQSVTSKMSTITPITLSNHTLEVIQEGDVTQSTFSALETMSRNLKDSQEVQSPSDNIGTASLSTATTNSQTAVSTNDVSVISSSAYDTRTKSNPSPRFQSSSKTSAGIVTKVLPTSTVTTQNVSLPSDYITQSPLVQVPSKSLLSPREAPNASTTIAQGSKPIATSLLEHQSADSQVYLSPSLQGQPFSPKAATQNPKLQQIDVHGSQKQKQKVVGIPPTSPQYQQLFMHQHQLLIMQFQQYQYQLQAQYQQLSQQQMSPQQQFLLQQQYHQQMVLLQRQFVQQQAQLQSMASTGMQFTEQELNMMYQQQMVAQQAYKQWVATLSIEQQGQLHARMQANMQQVQQGMAAMMQNILKSSAENSRERPKKQRGRRARKSKSDLNDPPTPAPSTPTQPQTPASLTDAASVTPIKDTEFDLRRKTVAAIPQSLSSGNQPAQQLVFAHQTAVSGQVQDSSKIAAEQSVKSGMETASQPGVQRQIVSHTTTVTHDQVKAVTQVAAKPVQSPIGFNSISATRDQRVLTTGRPDWPQAKSPRHNQQPKPGPQLQGAQTQKSLIPRVDIVPEGSNPFSDVYHEIEKKSKAPGNLPTTPVDQQALPNQTLQNQSLDYIRPDQLTPRAVQQQMHSSSSFYYPNTQTLIHTSTGSNKLNQLRTTPMLPQTQGIVSPMYSESQNVPISLQGAHYNVQTALVTLSSTTVAVSSVETTEAHIVSSNLQQQQQHWMQTTSIVSQQIPTGSNVLSQQQQRQVSNGDVHRTSSIMYPPQNGPTGNGTQQSLPYPSQIHEDIKISNEAQNQVSESRNPSQYPETYSQQTLTTSMIQVASGGANQYAAVGEHPVKDDSKGGHKRKKGNQSSQVSSANVDFSLLNPEEQRKFILERKREDFERRRRLLEEQRQLKLRGQENQKGVMKKMDKKFPKPKQQRKLKGVREKDAITKSTVAPLLVLEDKTLKLPLCEPEVHLLYPLVQPFGSGYLNGDMLVLGSFGNATLQGEADYYSQFPSPNPPVTSSNPPTPPSSLPPSPGTINQSLRDSLQMIPTEGIFDDLPSKTDMDMSRSYDQKTGQQENEQKDSKDGVLVTLTMSGNDRRVPNERVSYVTDMLGVSKPETIQVENESKEQPANEKAGEIPQATSVGRERDVHFSCLDNSRRREGDDIKGPFCKHCDISIHGTCYVECKNDPVLSKNSTVITVDDISYEKVTVTSSTKLSNAFCSQLCLNSYHSLSKLKSNSLPESFADDSGQFIDPVRSVIPVSTGEASNTDYFGPNTDSFEVRGDLQAPPSTGIIKRKISGIESELNKKKQRPAIWKRWKIVFSSKRLKKDSTKMSAIELLEKHGCTLKPNDDTTDNRECMLCGDHGDGVTEGTARLINYDVNTWVHLNCALWSLEVYETLNGALHNVQKAYERGIQTNCVYCDKRGATVTCARVIGSQMRRCEMNYHFNCAIKANCVFFKDKTVLCPQHKNYGSVDQRLPSYAVFRKVYVNRDITKQLASVLRLNNEKEKRAFTIRIGSLIFHELGQLLPHQLQKFHSKDTIYPAGFKTTRFYWSPETIGKRCSYLCSVEERDGNPHFIVSINDNGKKIGEFAGSTPKEVWSCIVEPVRKLREDAKLVKIFPEYVTGEDLFGLSDPSIQRIIESLPGVDTIHDYSFRFGRSPIIMAELPLAVNPTGCIRSESTRNVHLNRPVSLRTASSAPTEGVERGDSLFEDSCQGSLLRNSWAVSKTAQYRRMKSEWKNYVLLSKSRIQGLGLFAVRDIEPNTMIIEYIGSLIRNEVANKRERIYENSNRGVYMFRVDSDTVIDATMTGGPARYINHSCDPNCVAEVVIIEKMPKIIIISNRKLEKGEELTYDYKFEFEDDQHKIACLCGAANCRKWMN